MKTQIVPYQKNSILERMHGKRGEEFQPDLQFQKQYYILFAKFPPWQSVSIWRSYAFWTCFYAAAITSNANRFLTAAAVVAGMARAEPGRSFIRH